MNVLTMMQLMPAVADDGGAGTIPHGAAMESTRFWTLCVSPLSTVQNIANLNTHHTHAQNEKLLGRRVLLIHRSRLCREVVEEIDRSRPGLCSCFLLGPDGSHQKRLRRQ
jgi:hypothetical protein